MLGGVQSAGLDSVWECSVVVGIKAARVLGGDSRRLVIKFR